MHGTDLANYREEKRTTASAGLFPSFPANNFFNVAWLWQLKIIQQLFTTASPPANNFMLDIDEKAHLYIKHNVTVENTHQIIGQLKCWDKVDHLGKGGAPLAHFTPYPVH